MNEFMEEDYPSRLRRKDIRRDKFRREKEHPHAEFKKLQKRLQARVRDGVTDPSEVPGFKK